MKTFAIALAALAFLSAAELRADPYDQGVDCSKNLGGAGPQWQVSLQAVNQAGLYVGTVHRNGVQLYGPQSVYLEMHRQGGSTVWSSRLGTAYLSIDNDGFGTFTTTRYNYTVSRLNCNPAGVPERGGEEQ